MSKSSIVGLLTGSMFGAGLVVGGVHLPHVIQRQMLFKDFTMMEMFLTAMATSAASMAITLKLYPSRAAKPRVSQDLFGIQYGGNILGGFVMGCGMSIGGTCPGTVYAQLGAGLAGSIYALFGGLVGAYLYKYVQNILPVRNGKVATLQKFTGSSDLTMNCLIAVAGVAGVTLLSSFVPSRLPIVGGLLVGSSQLLTLLASGNTLGMSSSFSSCLTACASVQKNTSVSEKEWSSISMAVGAIFGGYIASTVMSTAGHSASVSGSFFGGLMVVLGARIASGCTSGHGISGVPTGGISSLITVASIFLGGAIAAAAT